MVNFVQTHSFIVFTFSFTSNRSKVLKLQSRVLLTTEKNMSVLKNSVKCHDFSDTWPISSDDPNKEQSELKPSTTETSKEKRNSVSVCGNATAIMF